MAVLANLLASAGDARANSTPPTCEREEVELCAGSVEDAPCGAAVPAKCVPRPCMVTNRKDDNPPSFSEDHLTCLRVNTCDELMKSPTHGAPCEGKTAGAACENPSQPPGATCIPVECEELAGEPAVYVPGRYLGCGHRREAKAEPAPSPSSGGCAAASSTNGSSMLVVLVAGAMVLAAVRRRSERD